MDLLAQSFNLIVCEGTGDAAGPCTYAHLILLVKNLITAMVILSTFIATGAFAYAGILLMGSGGNEGAKDKAKKMLWKVLIGYLWILAAWLIVYTISSVLLKDGFSLLEGLQ
jgi:putative copper export protein